MSLLSDIVTATPRINGFFAASTRKVDSGGTIVYAVAQCVTTVSQTGCNDCLTVAYKNIERCPPGAGGRAFDAGCFLRYSDTAFFDGNQTTDLTTFLRQQGGGGGSNKNKVIIGAVVGGVALLLFVAAFIIWFRFYRRKPKRERKGDILGATELRGPVNYNYKDLVSATKNFSEENKLGEGGFGDVYKVTDMGLLTGNNASISLLALPEVLPIYMRNFMLFPEDQSHINTRFAGTLGYTAPEYAIHGQLSSKVDTYSFGVVVLEIISGRKSNDMKLEPTTQYLLEWAWKLYEDEMLMDLVDESLNSEEYNTQEVRKVIEIAMLCTQSSVVSRPTMSEVVVLLLSKGSTNYTPTRPTFVDATKRIRGDTSTSTASEIINLPSLLEFPEIVGLGWSNIRGGLQYSISNNDVNYRRSSSWVCDNYLRKAIVSSKSTWDKASLVVMVIAWDELFLCRPGIEENTWIQVQGGIENFDVTYYKGKFYAIDGAGNVVVVEGLESSSPFTKTIIDNGDGVNCGSGVSYLIECSGDLLKVVPFVLRSCQTTIARFQVLKLDFEKRKWLEVKTLGSHALFVGYNHGLSWVQRK
ncbi:Cold-responsive protein kinase [Thalictrum thalictroides]|uniref:Cold-responsive protein kinase n=1 Tax=Thalictrum thalictroides TaxID=46969 RepID=A0A7J6V947_THATH|nr:Cold-responsive protein kinase [Thalictrum thalictroides]